MLRYKQDNINNIHINIKIIVKDKYMMGMILLSNKIIVMAIIYNLAVVRFLIRKIIRIGVSHRIRLVRKYWGLRRMGRDLVIMAMLGLANV